MATEIAELLAALRSGSDDDKANAAFALGNLAKRDPASQAGIASAGAIPLLVALVASGSLESRAKAARAITALACGNDTNRNGIISALLVLLLTGSKKSQANAAYAFARLCANDVSERSLNQQAIASAGAIPLLVSLSLHDADAWWALTALRGENEANLFAIVASLVSTGPDNSAYAVVDRLAELAENPQTHATIASAGAIPFLVSRLSTVRHEGDIIAVCLAIGRLVSTRDPGVKAAIMSTNVISLLVGVLPMIDAITKAGALNKPFWVLTNLEDDTNRTAFATAFVGILRNITETNRINTLKAIVHVAEIGLFKLWAEMTSPDVLPLLVENLVTLLINASDIGELIASRGLARLANSDENLNTIATSGAIPLLVSLLTKGDRGYLGKDDASAQVLCRLAGCENHRLAIASAGAIPPLVALLTNGYQRAKGNAAEALRKADAAHVLRSLALSEDQRSAAVSAGAIPPLVALLANGDDEAKSSASLALRELMPSSESSRNSVPVDSEEGHAVLHRVLNSSDHDMLIAFSSAYLRGVTRDFEDSRVLGRGSFGVVYEAVDERVRCRYAVKRLSVEAANIRRMLAQEVRILSRFFHPNIVRLVGYCDDHADLCLVYELAGKGSVDKILRDDGEARHFTWRHRVRAMCHVAKALNYLHKHDPNSPVFHRDVKSANIALTDTFEAKLIDCGLAKLLDENEPLVGVGGTIYTPTAAGSPLRFGTLGYTCSTYMRSGNFDAKSEIFSFGVTLLEVVTGRVQSCPDDLLMLFIEDDEEGDGAARLEDSFDRRAGEWPRELIDGLAQLIRQSCRKYTRRIPRMESVMRSLLELEARFCVETEEEAYFRRQYQTLLGDIERLRLEGLQKENELRAMQRTCTLCFGDDNLAGVECASGHFVCDSCFDHHVQAQCELSMEVLRGRDGGVLCPRNNAHYTPQCRAEAFSDQVVAQHVRDHTYVRYLGVRRSIWEHVIFQKSQAAIEQIRQQVGRQMSEELARNQLRESLQRDMPNARMCGRCGFGPVDHAFCYNLRTHHGETVGRGGRVAAINNACPQCGWFADEIAQWPTWDGVLWEERQQAGKGESFTAYTSAACL
ncbi:hypothetical protein ATCC90586_003763 [Pythium insidiosum]|nr:hypothetical protein ATCC90586_003763 [Pythium insidiosum]